MDTKDFRKELDKVMPGYKWTIHKSSTPEFMAATGTISSGFNRLSTLRVERQETGRIIIYEAKSSGYGVKAKWLHTAYGATLAQALRELQSHYEYMAATYSRHARDLQNARKK